MFRACLAVAAALTLSAIACTGPQGLAGPPGVAGAPGEPGFPGLSGQPGESGAPGQPGQPRAPRDPGKPGIRGPQGVTGLREPPGPAGEAGKDGAKGEPGDDAGDGQFPGGPDFGLRSPDNLDWAEDGYIYIQEDRSTANNVFRGTSGRDASIWQMNPSKWAAGTYRRGEWSAPPTAPLARRPLSLPTKLAEHHCLLHRIDGR